MKKITSHENQSLKQLIWKSLQITVVIPTLMMIVLCIIALFAIENLTREENISHMREYSRSEISKMANLQAETISQQLSGIANTLELYRLQMEEALNKPATLSPADESRLAISSQGIWHTNKDKPEGGASIYYLGLPGGENRYAENSQSADHGSTDEGYHKVGTPCRFCLFQYL